jgi:glycerol uptake facilitator-like aquaporin
MANHPAVPSEPAQSSKRFTFFKPCVFKIHKNRRSVNLLDHLLSEIRRLFSELAVMLRWLGFWVAPVSGASVNPARSFAPDLSL